MHLAANVFDGQAFHRCGADAWFRLLCPSVEIVA